MNSSAIQLFIGSLQPLPPEGQQTGIFKTAVSGPLAVTLDGLCGDRQGDRRVHGGPEKALHYYPAEHYDVLAGLLPRLADQFVPGVLGENLSARGLTEAEACLGDIFVVGSCRVQLSQPRQPCWKINHRLGHQNLSRMIADGGLTGWYFRVLGEGQIRAGDSLTLEARPSPGLTLARLSAANLAHRPAPAELETLAAASGLAPEIARRLRQRAVWLSGLTETERC
jgi:MOSC domain-containing protein YiiM